MFSLCESMRSFAFSYLLLALETLLGQPCLCNSWPSIWVHADQSTKAIDLEREQTFISCRALISEVLEDLFERSLGHRVFWDTEFSLLVFDSAKHKANCPLFLGNSKLVEVTTLLQDFNLIEKTSKALNEFESIGLNVNERHKVHNLDFTIFIKISLNHKIRS